MKTLLTKVPGFLRTTASLLSTLAAVSIAVPALNPYTEILTVLAGFFGGTGVVRAGARAATN